MRNKLNKVIVFEFILVFTSILFSQSKNKDVIVDHCSFIGGRERRKK
jgi:hypothetical protein